MRPGTESLYIAYGSPVRVEDPLRSFIKEAWTPLSRPTTGVSFSRQSGRDEQRKRVRALSESSSEVSNQAANSYELDNIKERLQQLKHIEICQLVQRLEVDLADRTSLIDRITSDNTHSKKQLVAIQKKLDSTIAELVMSQQRESRQQQEIEQRLANGARSGPIPLATASNSATTSAATDLPERKPDLVDLAVQNTQQTIQVPQATLVHLQHMAEKQQLRAESFAALRKVKVEKDGELAKLNAEKDKMEYEKDEEIERQKEGYKRLRCDKDEEIERLKEENKRLRVELRHQMGQGTAGQPFEIDYCTCKS